MLTDDELEEDECVVGMPDAYDVLVGNVPEDKAEMLQGEPGETWDWDRAVRIVEGDV